MKKQPDSINPPHYRTGGIETYDYIASKSMSYAQGNIIKYVTRYKLKGGLDDLLKARWFLDKLIDEAGGSRRLTRRKW